MRTAKMCTVKGCTRHAQPSSRQVCKTHMTEEEKLKVKDIKRKSERTIKGFLLGRYRAMKRRVSGKSPKHVPYYKGKELLKKKDFLNVNMGNLQFLKLYKNWVAHSYDQKLSPSVNRIDSSKGYTLDNMEWVTMSQNSALASVVRKANNQEILNRIMDNSSKAKISALIKKHKRFVITTAVNYAPVNEEFFKNLKAYCKDKNAALLIMKSGIGELELDEKLSEETVIFHSTKLNSNLELNPIDISVKTVNPLGGLARLGQRNTSLIIASPKQFLEPVAVGDNRLPHMLMTTGAVTEPYYKNQKRPKAKTDMLASSDHVLGAIVVEVQNDKLFHFRQLQADIHLGIVDLGDYYCKGKKSKLKPSHFVIGDYHVTETDEVAAKVWDQVSKRVGSPIRVHHDFFSGMSINHHEQHNEIRRAQLAENNHLSLEAELKECARVLDDECRKSGKVIMVESNHHDFLSKHYLAHGTYHRDPINLKIAARLVVAAISGKNPLRYALEKVIGLKHADKVVWLERDESYRVAGIELGAHGDKGSNGSKGSPATLEKAYGNCVVGHSHTPRIMRGFWQVGTSTPLKVHYTTGSSSWCQTSCLVYPNGARQLINCIDGSWTID